MLRIPVNRASNDKVEAEKPESLKELESNYEARNPRSLHQYKRGREVMPAGVAKGAYFHKPYPLFMASGDGCSVTTLDGQHLVDFANHHTAGVLGHLHPAVTTAIQKQLEKGIALGGPNETEYELASELIRRVPSLERIRFTCSGGEAALNVLRLVRGWTGRSKIAKFEGAFHGRIDSLEVSVDPPLDQAGPEKAPHPVAQGHGFAKGTVDDTLVLPFNRPKATFKLLEANHDQLAAVWLDPRAGILSSDHDFIRFVRRVTTELNLILVLDEVVSFRLGPGGLQEKCGVRPDLSTFGKIIGGGFPIGAFGGRADIMEMLDDSQGGIGYLHSGTFHGHPIALAAGLATLRTLTPGAYSHLGEIGDELREKANSLFTDLRVKAQAVGDGSLFAFHFTAEPLRDYRSMKAASSEQAYRTFLQLLEEDILMASGLSMNALSLPMDRSHVEMVIAALKKRLS